jgi:hypothetical protein
MKKTKKAKKAKRKITLMAAPLAFQLSSLEQLKARFFGEV